MESPSRGRRRLTPVTCALLGAGAVLALGVGAAVLLGSGDARDPAGTVVEVTMDMGGFDRSEIRARAGEPLTIRFLNPPGPFDAPGVGGHQLAIDELGVDLVVPDGAEGSVTFTPREPGTYVFYCDACCGGKTVPSMRGALVVEEG